MTTDRELLQQALDMLIDTFPFDSGKVSILIAKIKARLAEPQPDGYAVVQADGNFVGIWKSQDIAEKIVNRSPTVKNERVVPMVFAERVKP